MAPKNKKAAAREEEEDDAMVVDAAEDQRDNVDDDDDAMDSGAGGSAAAGVTKEAKKLKRDDFEKMRQNALVELAKEKERDRNKRIKFLVDQTELFQHFLETSTATGSAKKTLKDLLDSAGPGVLSPSKSKGEDAKVKDTDKRHHRKSEKEEDAEMIAETEEDVGMTFTETPKYINGEMRPYQVQGLNWLISLYDNGINGILADEMGLGKSLQTISLLGYLKNFAGNRGPHLLVTPKTTLNNWLNEFKKWCPSLRAFVLHGPKDERAPLVERTLYGNDWDVCVTSYEMVLLEKSALKKIAWQYIVIDEAHRIKNEDSMLSQMMRILESKNRLLITGTPLQNNLHELWALLNFLLPDVFGSAEDFDSWFTFSEQNDKEDVMKQLHKVLKPFLLRRLKLDVEHSLLPKKETKLYLGMSPLQKELYQKLLMKDIDAINGALGKGEGKTRLLNIVMQLRKCCNHPYLFDGVEPGPPYTTDEHLIKASGKMMVLDLLLAKFKANGSRVLLFSQMSRVLDLLEDYLNFRGYEYCRIDGQTDHESRTAQIDDYNSPGSSKFVFLLTTRAGGLGINLTSADIVILYDSDWNPQVDLQAQDRAHRIGQKKQVHVFRFVTEQSVEEKMIERAEMKLRLDQVVIQQGNLQQAQKAASKEELLNMIQHGAQDILHSKPVDGFSADDIEEILRKGEQKTQQLQQKLKDAGLDVLQSFSLDSSSTSVYQWEGEDYREKQSAGGFLNWIEPAKRDRSRSNYNVDEYYRDALSIQRAIKQPKEPRPPKQMSVNEFQFFPQRFIDLQEREALYYRKTVGYKAQKQEEQDKIDSAISLTDDEQAEKDKLTASGFPDWTRRDFYAFVKGCERFGRDNIVSIAAEIDGKTVEDVTKYSKVFWQRFKELPDYEKVITAIEKGEAKIKRREDVQRHIEAKVAHYRQPLQQLKIVYNQNKGKSYTDEEDRFLVVTLCKLGYGEDDVYDRIRKEIRESPLFRFDWFFKSRTSIELQRRCNTLILLIEKELEESDDYDDEAAKKKASSSSSSSSASKTSSASKPSASSLVKAASTASARKRNADDDTDSLAGDDNDSVGSPAPASSTALKRSKSAPPVGSDSETGSPAPSAASNGSESKSKSRTRK